MTPFKLKNSGSVWAYAALMPNLVFTLATATTSVTVSVTYSETDDGGNVISPGVAWLEVTGVSGFDKTFSKVDGYNEAENEIEYYWGFSGPGGADFSVRSDANIPTNPAVLRDCSKNRGPKVLCPMSAAGAYSYTLFAYEPSSGKTYNSGSVSLTTTVTEDSAFPTTRTICYSPDGNFTGAPTGASEISTAAALQTQITSRTSTTYRILLRRGETYTGSEIDFTWPAGFANCRVNVYGTGADPILQAPTDGTLFSWPSGGGTKDVFIGPLDCRGRWDAVNERGYLDNRVFEVGSVSGKAVCWGTKLTGYGVGFGYPIVDGTYFAAVNTDFSGWRQHGGLLGSHSGTSHIYLLGGILGVATGAVGGNSGRTGTGEYADPWVNGRGSGWGIRFGEPDNVVIAHVDSMVYGGDQDSSDLAQASFRYDSLARGGGFLSVCLSVIEGVALTNSVKSRQNTIVDGVLLVNHYYMTDDTTAIQVPGSGFAIRNCVQLQYDSRQTTLRKYGTTGTAGGTGNTAANLAYNVTSYFAGDGFLSSNVGGFTNNQPLTITGDAIRSDSGDTIFETSTTLSGYSPRVTGRKFGFPTLEITLGASWNNTETFDVLFTDARLDELDGTPTTQTYWNTTVAAGDTQHGVVIGATTNSPHYAADGSFSMTVLSDRLRFTNNSIGNVASGTTLWLKVDRASELVNDTSYASNALGTLGYPKLTVGAAPSWVASAAPISYRDFENTVRGATKYRGAIEYA